MCNNQEDDGGHGLQECPAVEWFNLKRVTVEDTSSKDITMLKDTEICINNFMEKVQNNGIYEHINFNFGCDHNCTLMNTQQLLKVIGKIFLHIAYLYRSGFSVLQIYTI